MKIQFEKFRKLILCRNYIIRTSTISQKLPTTTAKFKTLPT